jgi:hypothetical protein
VIFIKEKIIFSAVLETDMYACNGRHVYIVKHRFVVEYLFINQMLHFFPFPSSHLGHVSVLLCLAVTPVSNSSIMCSLST